MALKMKREKTKKPWVTPTLAAMSEDNVIGSLNATLAAFPADKVIACNPTCSWE